MRRRLLNSVGGSISASESVAGDICLYDKTNDKLVIISQSVFKSNMYPLDSYTPVGLVVVPGTHDVYGDGSCAIMSLALMDCDEPDSGSYNFETIVRIGNNFDGAVEERKEYNSPNNVGYSGNIYPYLLDDEGTCLPSDVLNPTFGYYDTDTFQNPYDTDTWYRYDEYYIASPYNEDDSRNPTYYQTSSPSSTSNCLSDFDGVGNTEIMISHATAQSNWKTATTITDLNEMGYYPAACCCWRYHTDGTSQGDWYLPACGELGYMIVKRYVLKQMLEKLNNEYGVTLCHNYDNVYGFLSSTFAGGVAEESTFSSFCATIYFGKIVTITQDDSRNCIAFTRVK